MVNQDINLPIQWEESTEIPREGLYLVAIRYPQGLGTYDIVYWNGNEWELGYMAEIVGWATTDHLISIMKAGWPEWDKSEELELDTDTDKTKKKLKP